MTSHGVDVVLACRLAGSRLFGKPLQLIDVQNNVTILESLVRYLESSSAVRSVNLAIADEQGNQIIAELAERRGWRYVFGDPVDVLGRILQAVDAFGLETVLRATTENPFVYRDGIDPLVTSHCEGGFDYSMFRHLPEGAGFSIISAEALRRSHRHGERRHRSELVTSYIFDHQETFRINIHDLPERLRRPEIRVTVDYPEDLVFCRKVYRDLDGYHRLIPLDEIIGYWDEQVDARRPLENIGIDWGHGRLWR